MELMSDRPFDQMMEVNGKAGKYEESAMKQDAAMVTAQ